MVQAIPVVTLPTIDWTVLGMGIAALDTFGVGA